MFCKTCGRYNPDDAEFCEICGDVLEKPVEDKAEPDYNRRRKTDEGSGQHYDRPAQSYNQPRRQYSQPSPSYNPGAKKKKTVITIVIAAFAAVVLLGVFLCLGIFIGRNQVDGDGTSASSTEGAVITTTEAVTSGVYDVTTSGEEGIITSAAETEITSGEEGITTSATATETTSVEEGITTSVIETETTSAEDNETEAADGISVFTEAETTEGNVFDEEFSNGYGDESEAVDEENYTDYQSGSYS